MLKITSVKTRKFIFINVQYDPVPGFIVNEQLGFLKFSKQKVTPEMECTYCGSKSFPIVLNSL